MNTEKSNGGLSNVEAEELILGAILLSNEKFGFVNDILNEESFTNAMNALLYKHICRLVNRNLVASPVTLRGIVSKEVSNDDENDVYEYMNAIMKNAYLVTDVEHIAKLVQSLYLKRMLVDMYEKGLKSLYSRPDIEASEHIVDLERELMQVMPGAPRFANVSHSILGALKIAEEACKNKGKIRGITTGFPDIDKLLNGMQNSDLLILASRPSMGKTSLATNIMVHAATSLQNDGDNRSVGLISLEMSSEQIAMRMLSVASGVSASKIYSGHIDEDEFYSIAQASRKVCELPVLIDDFPDSNIASIASSARRMKRKHNLGIIFVDYLQLIRANGKYSDNKVNEVSEITRSLKSIARELNIPIIALSQLSRMVEQRDDKRPQLSDLRDSGTIEQDADVVMFIFREEYYERRREPTEGTEKHLEWQTRMESARGKASVIIAKHRNGPIGSVDLGFDSNTTKFTSLYKEH